MDEKQRNHRDFLQNIAITLLSLTAVVLIAQTQLYNLGAEIGSRYFSQLFPTVQSSPDDASQAAVPAAPVRIAVTGTYGRYGDVTLVTSDEDFLPVSGLLKDALGTGRSYTVCSKQSFWAALDYTSIYYDFLSPLPLSVLAGITGGSAESSMAVRCLILSDTGQQTVRLYLWDGDSTYQVCSTAITRSDLEAVSNQYEVGNAAFAFDQTDLAYSDAAACSLFLTDGSPELPVLQVSASRAETDGLLTALKFNPRTNSRYTEKSGTEVVDEGERSVRISPDGTVLYRSSGEAALTIDASDPSAPTLWEAASGVSALVGSLLSAGDASPYLQSVQQSGAATVLRFGYQIGGVPIRFTDGAYAAEVTLTGSTISSLSLRFRQYTASSEVSLLLPPRQALAIAARSQGAELSIGYADNGASSLSACWLAD